MYHISRRLHEIHHLKKRWILPAIYLANLLLSFHYFFVIYINSSAISHIVSDKIVGSFYTIGSIFEILLLISLPRIIKKSGLYRFTAFFILLEFISILGLGFSTTAEMILFSFVGHLIAAPMILFTLDVYLENSVTDERATGNVRGLFLTVSNIALVISPAIVGLIIVHGQFWKVYAVSALFLIPLVVLVMRYFKPLSVVSIKKTSFLKTLSSFKKNKDLNNVFKAQIILQFFYAWMVIYMPVYLYEYIGFPWSKIGIMFTIMLLPFALFELPLGKLADEKLGEKEIMTVGFVIIGLSVLFIPFLTTASFFLWATLLFLTRTGASFVEITSESYFFKHVNGDDSDKISLFRLTRPLSYVLAPMVAMATLWFVPSFGSMFMILGVICLFGIRYTLAIKDTK